jgi:small subunit ribosomal protein S7
MSRRSIVKKRYPEEDSNYHSVLVSLLSARILKKGKKSLANSIILETFSIIKNKTSNEPLKIFETAIKRIKPFVEVKSRKIGSSTYQVPLEVSNYRGITLALNWLIKYAKVRAGRTISLKLANEIMDASNGLGNAFKKREEIHRMAEANKAFAHFRY